MSEYFDEGIEVDEHHDVRFEIPTYVCRVTISTEELKEMIWERARNKMLQARNTFPIKRDAQIEIEMDFLRDPSSVDDINSTTVTITTKILP